VRSWQSRSGKHCQQVHEHLEQPRDLGQVQADEIRVKMQGLIARPSGNPSLGKPGGLV
jgi:hypothetical protein